MHREAKQYPNAEFGAEKGLLLAEKGECMAPVAKTPNSRKGCSWAFLKAREGVGSQSMWSAVDTLMMINP